jgi:hypothetical protein
MLEVSIVHVDLPPSYRMGQPIRPKEALGGGGSGGGWAEPGAHEFSLALKPVDPTAPFALYADLAARGHEGEQLAAERFGPILLQITPDGKGIARLVK